MSMDTNIASAPLVSVIVPVYKVEKYLRQCVESLTGQTLRDIEIILVDDGSPDGCPDLCDKLAQEDSRIKVIHKQNEGLGLARNSGLEKATGKWVLFVDSDDFIALNALEYLVKIGESHDDVDQVRFLSTTFTDDSGQHPHPVTPSGSFIEIQDLKEKLLPILTDIAPLPNEANAGAPSLASAWSAIYRRKIFDESDVRFKSEREYISEDYVFNIEFARESRGIIFTPERFYFLRYNPGSLTRSLRRDRIEKSAFLCQYMQKQLEDLGFGLLASHVAMGCMLGYIRAHNNHIFDSALPLAEKRKLFLQTAENEYVKRVAKEYRFPRGAFRQKLIFALRRSYFPALLFTRLNNFAKGLLKK